MGVTLYPEVALPPGMVMPYAGSVAPDGWLICDGTLKLISDYPALYAVIGFQYSPTPGSDPGGGQFYLPNLKGKVIVGVDVAQTEFNVLGETGGSKTSTAQHTHSLSDHRHGLEAHTHPFTTDFRNTNHAHNVYARDQNTNWMNQNWSHWHGGNIGNVKYLAGEQPHDHGGGAGWAAEASNRQTGTAASVPINVNSTDINHTHNFNHDHPSTNYASESPWPGDYNHQHAGTTGGWNNPGGTSSPSINTSGASSAEAASGNLQPYMALHYLIKI